MKPPTVTHPSRDALNAFGLGKLDAASTDIVFQHLETCEDCRRSVTESSGDSFLGRLREARKPNGTPIPDKSVSGLARNLNSPESIPGSAAASSLPPELTNNAEYQNIKELGRGGMGVVYKAHNTLMGRDEVLKVMGKEIMSRPGAIDRFRREIQSAARLDHPNIVRAYSARLLGELLVFSMEYVPGDELGKVVAARSSLPVTNACYYVQQVANGLQHAHEKGMVHRDIKPANLILHVDREKKKHTVKILDFGLAKVTSEAGFDGNLTGMGRMLGTPDYIAPEQILDAQSADIRADVYSLGCTLYFLLAGSPPFQASSLYELLRQHREVDAQPLNLVCPAVPVELAGVVRKMMAKDPAQRFQTPAEVAKAMSRFVKPGAVPAKPQRELSQARVATTVPQSTSVELVAIPVIPLPALPTAPPVTSSQVNDWGTVVTDSTTERPVAKKAAVRRKVKSERMKWVWLVGAIVMLGVVLWTGAIFKMMTKDGTIVLENPLSDAKGPAEIVETFDWKGEKRTRMVLVLDIGGGEKIEFVRIPAGTFFMGSPDVDLTLNGDNGAFKDETPRHEIVLTKDFYLAKHELTKGQFARFVAAAKYETEPESDKQGGLGYDSKADKLVAEAQYTWEFTGWGYTSLHPVVNVTWNDADKFCEWSTGVLKEKKSAMRLGGTWSIRLPTEAEWEYACRGRTKTRWFTGDEPGSVEGYENLADASAENNKAIAVFQGEGYRYAVYDDRFAFTSPVGSFKPNPFGLYDMAGNVSEWCEDWKGNYKNEKEIDPHGATWGSSHVIRGGSWCVAAWRSRSAYRDGTEPSGRYGWNGFRPALVPSDR